MRQYGGEVRASWTGGYDEAQAEAARLARGARHARDPRLRRSPMWWRARARSGWSWREQAPDTRLVVVPLGGGGLAGGIAPGGGRRAAEARVVGVQAAACAPYIDSLAAHRPVGARSANTICDGIAVKRPGDYTLPAGGALRGRGRDGVRRPGGRGHGAAARALEARGGGRGRGGRGGADARPRGAARRRRDRARCSRAATSTPRCSSECIRLGETAARRRVVLSTVVPDRPGALAGLLAVVAEHGAQRGGRGAPA